MGVDDLSPQLVTALGRVMPKTTGSRSLLSAAEARDPQDFWLNCRAGLALSGLGSKASPLVSSVPRLALRPKASLAHNAIGLTLGALGRSDEAIRYLQQALED